MATEKKQPIKAKKEVEQPATAVVSKPRDIALRSEEDIVTALSDVLGISIKQNEAAIFAAIHEAGKKVGIATDVVKSGCGASVIFETVTAIWRKK